MDNKIVKPLPLQAVLFDLDNTLYDRDLAFEKWTRGFVEEQFAEEHAVRRAEIVQKIIELDEQGRVIKEVLFTRVRALYPTITQEVETLCERFYHGWLVYMTLEQEALALLAALETADIPYGIVTNGPPQQHLKIRQLGLKERVRCLFVSAEFGCNKPDPAIFRAAADCLGVPCEQILFVGDNPEADICGAKSAGMSAAWLPRGTVWPASLTATQPDYSIQSLQELAAILNLLPHP